MCPCSTRGAEPPYLNATNFNLSYWKNDQYNVDGRAGAITATDYAGSKAKYVEALNIVEEAPAVFFFDTMAVSVVPKSIELPLQPQLSVRALLLLSVESRQLIVRKYLYV
ncbi:MAG: hypothetical protein U0X93_00740 [Anaerolineales bacterium]